MRRLPMQVLLRHLWRGRVSQVRMGNNSNRTVLETRNNKVKHKLLINLNLKHLRKFNPIHNLNTLQLRHLHLPLLGHLAQAIKLPLSRSPLTPLARHTHTPTHQDLLPHL